MDLTAQGAMTADRISPMDVGIAAVAPVLQADAPVIPAGGCLLIPGLVGTDLHTDLHPDGTCILDRCTASKRPVADAVRLTRNYTGPRKS